MGDTTAELEHVLIRRAMGLPIDDGDRVTVRVLLPGPIDQHPRLSWHQRRDGTYRVVAVWFGRVDVAARVGFTCDSLRDGWRDLGRAGHLPLATVSDPMAWRAFVMLGRVSDWCIG